MGFREGAWASYKNPVKNLGIGGGRSWETSYDVNGSAPLDELGRSESLREDQSREAFSKKTTKIKTRMGRNVKSCKTGGRPGDTGVRGGHWEKDYQCMPRTQ